MAFMLTFNKGFDNFYANVGYLRVARKPVTGGECA
jgi:hypothetical protein